MGDVKRGVAQDLISVPGTWKELCKAINKFTLNEKIYHKNK